MDAINVEYRDGCYGFIPSAQLEDWDEVRRSADSVERVGTLAGWGRYTASYRVVICGEVFFYFVVEGG